MTEFDEIDDMYCCPSCKGTLVSSLDFFNCIGCNALYEKNQHFPIFLPKKLNSYTKRVITLWNDIDFQYTELIARDSMERFNLIDQPLISQCSKGKRVLEIGCGNARLKEKVEMKGSIYFGIDPSLTILNQIGEGFRDRIVCGIGECLPYKNESFDVVIGGYASFRYIDFHQLLSECSRVLVPKGVLAFTLFNSWPIFLFSLIKTFGNWKTSVPRLKGDLHDVISLTKEKSILREHGFCVCKILCTKKIPIPFINKFLKWDSYWHGVLGSYFGLDIIIIAKKSRRQ